MHLTSAQEWTLLIAQKITSLVCIPGSLFMIIDVSRSSKKLGSSYHRIILGMSVCLLLTSVTMFAINWDLQPVGQDKDGPFNKPLCMAERFAFVFDISVVMYNVALSIYYFLIVQHNWSKARIRKIEPWLHIFAVGWGLMIATILVIIGNTGGDFDVGRCIDFSIIGLYVFLIPIWIAMIAVTVMNLMVYRTVRNQEDRNERYRFRSQEEDRPSRKLSRQVALQGVSYVFPFYIAWIPFTASLMYLRYVDDFNPTRTGFFAPWLTVVICEQLQGILNVFVYIAPRFKKYRTDRPESSCLRVIGLTLCRTLCYYNMYQTNDHWSDDESEDGSRRILASAENNTEPLLGPGDDGVAN